MKKKENIENEDCNERRPDNVMGSQMNKNVKEINLFHKIKKQKEKKKIVLKNYK